MKKQSTPKLSPNLFPVVGVGASAGGLQAFIKFISGIPENSGMAYVLVQHLDPTHQSSLPELLQKTTNIPVMQVTDDIKVEPDNIYIIPSGQMMKATDGVLQLSPRPPKKKEERNLPIDLFFTSLADVHQAHSIGVVLSGTSTDGTQGLRAIKDHGGLTFAQDEESAQYDGMPNSAMQAGVVDFVLPPEEITGKIMEVCKQTGSDGQQKDILSKDGDVIYQILSLIRVRKGTDFNYYKKPTIHRRILRRMAMHKMKKPAAYLKLLREDNREQDLLYQDMLIPVTSFFRDTPIFEDLCSKVFPQVVKNKKPLEPIRIWVAGCSTGQEAYSIAICFREFLDANPSIVSKDKVQIFATDISQVAINEARKGIYDKNELENISDKRLQKFFTKTNGGYQVNKDLRNMCVFATHNFLKDPPFSKIDFISCRNALIYMEPYLQKKALTTFHYALNPKEYLLLGKSETTSGVPDLFEPVNKHEKLFVRKDKQGVMYLERQIPLFEANSFSSTKTGQNEPAKTDFQKTADEVLLKKYTPPGVVVNEAMDIVQFRGSTGAYLEPSSGKPDFNLLMMAKPGLSFELRNILHKAKTTNKPFVKEKIPFEINGMPVTIKLEAIPLPNMADQHYLVLFESSEVPSSTDDNKAKSKTHKAKGGNHEEPDQNVLRIQQLELELAQTKEDMATFMEEQEAVNEELQSANEELLSSSEELQSVNEELETSSEELQSTNEELTIVNQELAAVNEHIRQEKNNLESVLASIPVPLLVLDKTLRVKIANEEFYKSFKVNERETENKLVYTLGNGQWNIPQLRVLLESILPDKTIFKDFEVTRDFENIGKRYMLLNAREIKNYLNEKLILLVIEDITEKKLAEESKHESEIKYSDLMKNLPIATYSCDAQGYITYYNKTAANLWGREPVIGKEKWSGSDKIFRTDGSQVPLEESPVAIVLKEGKYEPGEEFIIERADSQRSFVVSFPQVSKDLSGKITGAVNTLIDITSQKKAQQDSELIQQQKDDFIGIASHELKTPITVIKSYSQILESLLKEKGSVKEAAMTAKMVVQVDKINSLIIDLLDTTKINRGKLQFNDADFDFSEMVKDVLEDMKSTTRTHEIILESGPSCTVHADKERIAQVVDNFISNALKYSPKADKIIVRTELKDNHVTLSVQDFGIGIDADKKDRVFEQFYRVIGKGVPNTYPGIGLGLFISSEIVKRENGKIGVESEKGKGSTFYFSLPCVV